MRILLSLVMISAAWAQQPQPEAAKPKRMPEPKNLKILKLPANELLPLMRQFSASLGVQCVPFDELFAAADYVSLHVGLTERTRHLVGARELGLMKRSACLINTARGAIVDEAALVAALAQGRIAGAGLDVHEHEPRIDPALLAMPNVVLTPHIGSAVVSLRQAMAHLAVDNLLAVASGERAPNCFNATIYAAPTLEGV